MTHDLHSHAVDPTQPSEPAVPPVLPTPQAPTGNPAGEEVPVGAPSITEYLVRESISDEENRLTANLHIQAGHTVKTTSD